ncbi:MAG: hypothetical protein MPJ08_07005 [Nitrosopumilus sp.]|nr:hypothetical protein [Nitrosopumilus sp.]
MLGSARSYSDLREEAGACAPLLDILRDACMSLDGAVEDVRMHRVVFGKTVSFRWFADLAPDGDAVVVKIQRDRKEEPRVLRVSDAGDAEGLAPALAEAHGSIR